MKDIIIVCNDLFGLEIYSLLEQIDAWNEKKGYKKRYNVLGFISENDNPFARVASPIQRVGTIDSWKPIREERYVLGIKLPKEKEQVVRNLTANHCIFETVCAPWTLMQPIEIGEGSIVAAYSIKPGLKIGRFVTTIDSMIASKTIGDYSTIMRFSNVTGDVGDRSFVGNHVYTHLGKTVGKDCYVIDGSIVVKDVKPGTTVKGVPARIVK